MHFHLVLKSFSIFAFATSLVACGGSGGSSGSGSNMPDGVAGSTSSSSSSSSSSSGSAGDVPDSNSGLNPPLGLDDQNSILSSTGSFAQGAESFVAFFADNQNGVATFDNEAMFELNAPPSAALEAVQLIHPVSIELGTQYTVCYNAKADATRTISVAIDASEDGFFSEFASEFRVFANMTESLGTEYAQYMFTFDGVADATARLIFNLGLDGANVSIDNVGVFRGNTCGVISQSVTARDIAPQMGMGINIGNTFDAHSQGRNVVVTDTLWRPTAIERKDIQNIVAEGYGHVRIPATWYDHTLNEPPYTVDVARLDRYEEVVDWALEEGLFVMINAHHEEWIVDDYNDQSVARFTAIWDQLIARFANKSPKLLFEVFNEPGYFDNATQATISLTSTQTDTLNRIVLERVRESQPTRLVVYAGTSFSGISDLQKAVIPDANDKYLFANFHSYDPFQFGITCTEEWLVERDRDTLEGIYQAAVAYSVANNDVPLMINEFGAPDFQQGVPSNDCDDQQRLDYIQAHAELAKQYNIVPTVWSDGGTFRIYTRSTNAFDPASDVLLDAFGRK